MADDKTLDLLLRKARSHGEPARFVYLRSRESREKLRPALAATNLEKTLNAPMVCIVAHDLRFWENLPRMFHNPEAINWFRDKGAHTEITAFRNGTLQGAYYLLALRAVGLDCGAMSGFDNAKVDAAFFPDGRWKSNFLVNIGHGSGKGIAPRNPRLSFEESCRIV